MATISLKHDIVQPGASFGAKAGAAISYAMAAVKMNATTGEVIQTAASNDPCVGFIQEGLSPASGKGPASGDHVSVVYTGVVWAIAAGTIALHDECMVTVAGLVLPRGTTAGTIYNVCGIALAATTINLEFPLQLRFYEVQA